MEAARANPMTDQLPRTLAAVSSEYQTPDGFADEVFGEDGAPREHAVRLIDSLDRMGRMSLLDLGRRRDRAFTQRGITFEITSPDGEARDRPFPLDLVPRIVPAAEWEMIERGLRQRIKALNAFIADVYGRQEILREGIVPWELVLGCPSFRRAVHGVPCSASRSRAGNRRPTRRPAATVPSRCFRPWEGSRRSGARSRPRSSPETVAEFLTFETDYPHSVAASIEALQRALDEIGPSGRGAPPVLRLARLRAELEFHRGQEARGSIGELLEHIQQELAVVDAEVERRYFTGETPLRQVVSA